MNNSRKEILMLSPTGREFQDRLVRNNQLNLEFLRTLDLVCKKENVRFKITIPKCYEITHMFSNIVLDFAQE